MKDLFRTGLLIVSAIMLFASCERADEPDIKEIEGTYTGTLESLNDINSKNGSSSGVHDATAEVAIIGDQKFEVHCFGGEMDTTFTLNYYANHDSINVCLTGDDFEDMYGHMPGEHHSDGGMMEGMHGNETEWMSHMHEEHDEGDEHFGGFDMNDHSFGYIFKMKDGDTPYYLEFSGIKQ